MVAGGAGVWMFYVQHQFEDVYWERGEDWSYVSAALEGSSFYKLPRVQRTLLPFYERRKMRWRTYSELLYGWLVENQAPHTNWDGERIPHPSSLIPDP